VPWFAYYDSSAGSWVQGYYDDVTSLAAKYDMVNARGLAGTGMWTLLMDQGDNALWNLLAAKFVNDTTPPNGGIRILPAVTDASAVRVDWAATDVGSGVAGYSLQVRDRAAATWLPWLSGTTATSGYFAGEVGHSYEFRVSAIDFKGNAQPWLAANPEPGSSLSVGGFARVDSDTLNVRSGAGTGFTAIDQLTRGDLVAVLGGPVDSGGYRWYQVQFDFSEWPSSDYPRVGWAASGPADAPYLVPAAAPTTTRLAPAITGYAASPRWFSPNGDGTLDGTTVTFTLPAAATAVRLDVLSAAGQTVRSIELGARAAGAQTAAWDGRVASGGWAPAGAYLLRITANDAAGTHVAPAAGVDAGLVSRWGVTADLAAPTVVTLAPLGTGADPAAPVTAVFGEPVSGVAAGSFRLVDTTAGTPVSGSVTYYYTSRKAVLRPSAALIVGHLYRATLTGSIRDAAGNRLSPIAWTFRVAEAGTTQYNPARTLTFLAGTTTGYGFDAAGRVIASKSATLSSASGAPTSQRRQSLPGQTGSWFLVSAGIWDGYWVRESPSVYLPGISWQETFSPTRTLTFAAGTYTGYQFDVSGRVTASKAATLSRGSGAATSARAIINGRRFLLVANGIWAGYWVPETSSTVVS
jgi:hypothetical protein